MCVLVYMCIYVFVCTYVRLYIHTGLCVCVCVCARAHARPLVYFFHSGFVNRYSFPLFLYPIHSPQQHPLTRVELCKAPNNHTSQCSQMLLNLLSVTTPSATPCPFSNSWRCSVLERRPLIEFLLQW